MSFFLCPTTASSLLVIVIHTLGGDVATFKGTVQLSGWVDSEAARERATEVARNIDGVRDVKNSLGLRGRS